MNVTEALTDLASSWISYTWLHLLKVCRDGTAGCYAWWRAPSFTHWPISPAQKMVSLSLEVVPLFRWVIMLSVTNKHSQLIGSKTQVFIDSHWISDIWLQTSLHLMSLNPPSTRRSWEIEVWRRYKAGLVGKTQHRHLTKSLLSCKFSFVGLLFRD